MPPDKIEQIRKLLKGIETGDPSSVSVVNEARYIQHNPQTHEGSEGLAELFRRLSETSPRVNIVRAFDDDDFVFAHTEYDFATRNIGFEIFRFEDGQAVEHWDNIQKRKGPNRSGHSMVDGATEVSCTEATEASRSLIKSFIDDIMIQGNIDKLSTYVSEDHYTEHNPGMADGLAELDSALSASSSDYKICHHILADGDFVLSVCEGYYDQVHSSFFDLFRLQDGRIVEHWDTTEAIPPRSEWKNDNGKF